MKTILNITLSVFFFGVSAQAQDRLSRIGGFTGGVPQVAQPPATDPALLKGLKDCGAVGIYGRVLRRVPGGLLIDCRQGDYQVSFTFFGVKRVAVDYASMGTPTAGAEILLRYHPDEKGLVDNDWVSVVGFLLGSYTDAGGDTRRVFSVLPPIRDAKAQKGF